MNYATLEKGDGDMEKEEEVCWTYELNSVCDNCKIFKTIPKITYFQIVTQK